MNIRTVTERLIWLKQHALTRRIEAPRIAQAYTDELHTRAAELTRCSRTDPDYAARILDTLLAEIAHTRNRLGIVADPALPPHRRDRLASPGRDRPRHCWDINPADDIAANERTLPATPRSDA